MHRGVLETDAPALWAALRRALPPGAPEELAGIYLAASKAGALSEQPVTREKGVSFNPRPARICQILIKECGESDTGVLAAAVLACCPEPLEVRSAPPTAREVAAAARAGRSKYRIPVTEPARSICMALFLDDIRHLHMASLEAGERARILAAGSEIAGAALEGPAERLRKLIEASVERAERHA